MLCAKYYARTCQCVYVCVCYKYKSIISILVEINLTQLVPSNNYYMLCSRRIIVKIHDYRAGTR